MTPGGPTPLDNPAFLAKKPFLFPGRRGFAFFLLMCLLALFSLPRASEGAGEGFRLSSMCGKERGLAAGGFLLAMERHEGTEQTESKNLPPRRQGGAPPDAFAFAQYLLEKGRWAEAATEFQRFCYFHPGHPLVPRARLRIGTCYERGEQFSEAVNAYQSLAGDHPLTPAGREARYRVGEVYYRAGRFEEATVALERFLQDKPADPWGWKARYRIAWASLHLHAFAVAAEQFSELASRANPFQKPAREILAGIEGIKGLRYRSPLLAGFLSGLLPGSGQVYAGATKDGLLAFLVNGALIAASYQAFDKELYGVGGVVSFVALTFYAGNVYGAVNSTHHANQEGLVAHLRSFRNRYEWITDEQEGEGEGAAGLLGNACFRISRFIPGRCTRMLSVGSLHDESCKVLQ